MKRNWLTRTLIVLMTLAMVVGVVAIKPKTAEAASLSPTIQGSGATIPVGGKATLTVIHNTTGSDTYDYVWSLPSGLDAPNKTSQSITITGLTAGTYTNTITVSVHSSNGTDYDDDVKASLTVAAMSIDATASVGYHESKKLTVNNQPYDGNGNPVPITWSSNRSSVTVNADGTVYGEAVDANAATITATAGSQTDTCSVTVTQATGVAKFTRNALTLETGSGAIDLISYVERNGFDGTVSYSPQGAGTYGTLSGSMFTPGSTAGSVNITLTPAGGVNYTTPGSSQLTITLQAKASFSVSPTSVTVNPVNSYTTFTATSSPNGTISVESLNGNIATATVSGSTVTVTGKATGNTYIRVRSSGGTGYVDVPVRVGNPTPTIKAYFDPDNYNLNKSTGYITLHIEVSNPQSSYVTIKRSNIRTYAKNYTTHDSTYYYTANLDTDGHARFYIHPQYNGTTYYTVSATGASSVQTHNLTVSGYTTMPQTGPDYTWVYILGGLCVAALAAAVTLNARKKKQQAN